MDKGKKALFPEEIDFSRLANDYRTNNVTPLAPPGFSIFFDESAGRSPKEKIPSLVDEMDQVDKEEFFSKFLSMNSFEYPDPSPMEQHSMLPGSGVSRNNAQPYPALLPNSHNLSRVKPPAPADDDKDKPLVFRKTMPPQVLAEVAMCDPKRARRIVFNRLSAIRAKERKKLYMYTLEHKMQTLQFEATELHARLNILETEGTTLHSENTFLKNQLEITLQQMQLQDTLNDQIRGEIQHMKMILEQDIPNLGAILESHGCSSNQDMNAPLLGAAQLPEFQLQNPYLEQGPFYLQNEQPYLGPENFGVRRFEGGESSQILQQLYRQNPLPNDQLNIHCQNLRSFNNGE